MRPLDCVVIGHNEPPFEVYEAWLRGAYGVDSESYRDLRFNFVEVGGRKRTYVDLLNDGNEPADGPYRSGDIPHLAAAYLTQFLRRAGLRAEFVSLFQADQARLGQLLDAQPRCVAITTTLYVVNDPAAAVVEFARAHAPGAAIVLGGPLVANHDRNYGDGAFEAALRDLGADYYVIESQGEATLAALVGALRDGEDPAAVPNLAFFRAGRLVRTPRVPERNDVGSNALDWRRLVSPVDARTLQTRTARSCAFSCAFCNYPTRAGALATMDVEAVRGELESMRALGTAQVIFIDDTFNVPTRRFKELCRMMIRERFGLEWFSYFRGSNADAEAIDLMAESGCRGVFLGIESGAPSQLKNMVKHAEPAQYLWSIERLRAAGILTFASFIVGFPGETGETVAATRELIQHARPDFYRAQLWYNEPGAPIRARQAALGIEGDGFVWRHDTMSSLEAMDHIDRLFLSITDSAWLPQWSFDFWILPYLFGRGLGRPQLETWLRHAHELLRIEIAGIGGPHRETLQQQRLRQMSQVLTGAGRTVDATLAFEPHP
jgi:p-methyltransferase